MKNNITLHFSYSDETTSLQAAALSKLQADFADATRERKEQICTLERSMGDQVRQTDELKDILQRQQTMVDDLGEQVLYYLSDPPSEMMISEALCRKRASSRNPKVSTGVGLRTSITRITL